MNKNIINQNKRTKALSSEKQANNFSRILLLLVRTKKAEKKIHPRHKIDRSKTKVTKNMEKNPSGLRIIRSHAKYENIWISCIINL